MTYPRDFKVNGGERKPGYPWNTAATPEKSSFARMILSSLHPGYGCSIP
jgi:hypothetical protein